MIISIYKCIRFYAGKYSKVFFLMNGNTFIQTNKGVFYSDLENLLQNFQKRQKQIVFTKMNKYAKKYLSDVKLIDKFEYTNSIKDSVPEYFI